MSALVGFVKTHPSTEDPSVLEGMLRGLMHEPSYASASAAWAGLNLCAGWISANGSGASCEWNGARNIALVLRGEVFADVAVADAGKNGHGTLQSLISLYEKRGIQFLEELNGWFGGLLVDLRTSKAVLFNDRYGLGRVYYHQSADSFYFASEAKPLLKLLPASRRLDEQGLAEWLTCGCVLQNRTLFPGISLLPPGSAWTFSAQGQLSKNRYFDPAAWETQPPLTPAEYYESLKATFPAY